MPRILRTLAIFAFMLLAFQFGPKLFGGGKKDTQTSLPAETYVNAPGFEPDVLDPSTDGQPNAKPKEGELCIVQGSHFEAELSSRGAAIRHLRLKDPQFAGTDSEDMSTTPDHERWRSLRTLFRSNAGDDQFKYDRFPWKLEKTETGCRFTYLEEGLVKVTKTVSAGSRPYELNIETEVQNLASEKKMHTYSIENFAFRRNGELKSSLGRQSPHITELSCAKGKEVTRKGKDDFTDWFTVPSVERYAAMSNGFFAQALVPDGMADCKILAEAWYGANQAKDDDRAGAVYHARLAYGSHTLNPNEKTTYQTTAFFGPKDRALLASAGGGTRGLSDLINLGFFSPVAKVLVGILVFYHLHFTGGNWGLAIILMTLSLRIVLFPLSWPGIKNTIAMRKLRPELDAILKNLGDDSQAKSMATMEFYRARKVNMFGGCLPQLIQMPVWFAMFTTLQTAVELYHTQFLWFKDLSAPDPYFIVPIVLGGCMILQQKIVPAQGMDPAQQKMMMYLMPIFFTTMMLFLPAGLALYSLTNSVTGILQQLIVEYVAPRSGGKKGEILVKEIASS